MWCHYHHTDRGRTKSTDTISMNEDCGVYRVFFFGVTYTLYLHIMKQHTYNNPTRNALRSTYISRCGQVVNNILSKVFFRGTEWVIEISPLTFWDIGECSNRSVGFSVFSFVETIYIYICGGRKCFRLLFCYHHRHYVKLTPNLWSSDSPRNLSRSYKK